MENFKKKTGLEEQTPKNIETKEKSFIKDDFYYAVVSCDLLNVRELPEIHEGNVLGIIDKNQEVIVELENAGWCKITAEFENKNKAITGYVKKEFLTPLNKVRSGK